MKKMIAMLLALTLMMTAAMPAFATTLNFTLRNFYGGQTLAVYRGPGEQYGRSSSSGYAKALTDEPLYAAGKENGWMLVLYGTKGNSYRVGWVDMSQLKYNTDYLKIENLYFEYRNATITSGCYLTDDPVTAERDLAYLNSGTRVTYLGNFYQYSNWAYIETWANGGPVRAFVPMNCISVN